MGCRIHRQENCLTGIAFFAVSLSKPQQEEIRSIYAVAAYTTIILTFSALYSYKTNRNKRNEYIKNVELEQLSSTDSLTGLPNRRKFNSELVRLMKLKSNSKMDLSLIWIDLDDFKVKNDEYGHVEGDKLISEFASCIAATIRKSDILCRWGGDEFITILPNTNAKQATEIAERIRKCVNGFYFSGGHKITCSTGVTDAQESEDLETFLRRADNLLYIAKQSGKNMIANSYPTNLNKN